MARHEDETEEIVADVLVDRRVRVLDLLIAFSVASELFVLALEGLAAPDQVSGAVLRGSHQPSARPLRHARGRPLLERSNEGVLRELLSRPDVSDGASQPGDEPGRLDPPYRFNRAMRFGGCCVYGECLVTRPRAGRSHGPRRSRHRRELASATRGPRRASAPATTSNRPRAPWSRPTARRSRCASCPRTAHACPARG